MGGPTAADEHRLAHRLSKLSRTQELPRTRAAS